MPGIRSATALLSAVCSGRSDHGGGPRAARCRHGSPRHRPRVDGEPITILGTPGDDTIHGTAGPDVIHGQEGNDVILGLGGDDVICDDAGDQHVLRGGAGADRLFNTSPDGAEPISAVARATTCCPSASPQRCRLQRWPPAR